MNLSQGDMDHQGGANRKARIAVIGTGWWATYAHLPALVQRPCVEVVALANRGADKLRKAAEAFGVESTYTSYREMLDRQELDGVIVAASHDVHYEAAKAALQHDCHVLVEKPLALRTQEARELLQMAERSHKVIVMSCPWQYTAQALRAREVIRSGELGEIQLVSSLFSSFAGETYRANSESHDKIFDSDLFGDILTPPRKDANIDPKRGGGQGWVQVSHSASLLLWVTGLLPQRVSAYMNRCDVTVDVVDAVSMSLSNGAIGVLSSTGRIPVGDAGQHCLWVYGSKGYLVLDVIAGTLLVQKQDTQPESLPPLPKDDRYPRFAPVNNFVDVILNDAENHAPGAIGCLTVAFLEAAYQSAAGQGSPTRVPTV